MTSVSSAIPSPNPTSAAWSEYLWNQPVNLTTLSGEIATFTLADLDTFRRHVTKTASVYAFACGSMIMLFLVMVPMTQSRQRRTPIFILNLISLFVFAFRELILVIDVNLPVYGIGGNFLGAVAQYRHSQYWPRFFGLLLTAVYFLTVTTSLVLQFRVAFAASPKTQKIVTWVAIVAAFGFNCFSISWQVAQGAYTFNRKWLHLVWLYDVTQIYFICFVGIGSLLFLFKLGSVIYRRRQMGMDIQSFGPLQIIFVFFVQCLIVPRNPPLTPSLLTSVILFIVDFTIPVPLEGFQDLTLMVVVCSLPLSSLWAAAATEGPRVSTIYSVSDSSSSKPSTGGWPHNKKSHAEPKGSLHSADTDLENGTSGLAT
jgi:pheromone alpha factor receptor